MGRRMEKKIPNYKNKYVKEIVPALLKSGRYANVMSVPRIVKITVNMGINTSVEKDVFKSLSEELAAITGQRPIIRKAKKSISNFKLREGMPVGAQATLRGAMMYEFLERLICAALPRIRDFRGIPRNAFDGRGNYTLGLTEQIIFPEINPDEVKKSQGMNVTIVTTAKDDESALELLTLFGMPFAGGGKKATA